VGVNQRYRDVRSSSSSSTTWATEWFPIRRARRDSRPSGSIRIGLSAEAHAQPVPDQTAARPSAAQIRAWARANGITVPDHGRLRPEIHKAWRELSPVLTADRHGSCSICHW